MDDLVTLAALSSTLFFFVISVALLARYRQVSLQLANSTDLGHDLWSALESRLTKQDERVLDLMGRMEVLQSRVLSSSTKASDPRTLDKVEIGTRLGGFYPPGNAEQESREVTQRDVSSSDRRFATLDETLRRQEEVVSSLADKFMEFQSRGTVNPSSTESVISEARPRQIDGTTERALIRELGEQSRTSVEIRNRFGISREHAARMLKTLMDRGLATRKEDKKPFVYQLTEKGRTYLSET